MVAQIKQNFGLDIVRSAAILLVLFAHAWEWWLPTGRQTDILTAYIGLAGVNLFFSLSGFLIGGILLRKAEEGVGLRMIGQFWSRRWLRTLPAYWVTLLVLDWRFGFEDWRSPLFLQNFVSHAAWTPGTWHTWSLTLEEWFYLFVPLMLAGAWGLLGFRRSGSVTPMICLGLILWCTVGRYMVGLQPSYLWGDDPSINPILRLDCAAWGVLAAWIVRKWTIPRGLAVSLIVTGCAMLVGIGRIWVLSFEPERLLPLGFAYWWWAWQPLLPALIELSAAMVVLGIQRILTQAPRIISIPVGLIARLSYALYLVHLPILQIEGGGILEMSSGWVSRLWLILLIIGAAVMLRYCVELPVLALRERWVPERHPRRSLGDLSNSTCPLPLPGA